MPPIIGIKKLHQDLTQIAQAASRGESKIRFNSKDRNLSKKVDRIVYEI